MPDNFARHFLCYIPLIVIRYPLMGSVMWLVCYHTEISHVEYIQKHALSHSHG